MSRTDDLNLYLCEHFGVESVQEALDNGEITDEQVEEATRLFNNKC